MSGARRLDSCFVRTRCWRLNSTRLPGLGQADGGLSRGTYLEFGIAPGISEPDFAVAFPLTIGLSLDDYYELAGVDHAFY